MRRKLRASSLCLILFQSVDGMPLSLLKRKKNPKTKQEVCDRSDLHLAYAFACCEVRVNMYPYSLTASGRHFACVSIDTQHKAAARQTDGLGDLRLQQVGDNG